MRRRDRVARSEGTKFEGIDQRAFVFCCGVGRGRAKNPFRAFSANSIRALLDRILSPPASWIHLREIEGDGSQHSEFISPNSFYVPVKGKSATCAPYAAKMLFHKFSTCSQEISRDIYICRMNFGLRLWNIVCNISLTYARATHSRYNRFNEYFSKLIPVIILSPVLPVIIRDALHYNAESRT